MRRACLFLFLLALVCPVDSAQAQDWSLESTLFQSFYAASNPFLVTGGGTPLYGSVTSPDLVLKRKGEDSLLDLDTRVDQNIFNQSTYDSTDLHLKTDTSIRQPLWAASLGGGVDLDTTRTSELVTYGRTPVSSSHTGLRLLPEIAYTLTPQDRLGLSSKIDSSNYANAAFTDYALFAVTPVYTHQVTPLSTLSLRFDLQHFEALGNAKNKIDTLAPLIGWEGALLPTLTAHLAAGGQARRASLGGKRETPVEWDAVWDSGLSWKGLNDRLDVTSVRAETPYGNGTSALQTSIGLVETHSFTPLFDFRVGGSYAEGTYPVSVTGSLSTLAMGQTGLAWHVTDSLALDLHYQYRAAKMVNIPGTAEDHMIGLQLEITKPLRLN